MVLLDSSSTVNRQIKDKENIFKFQNPRKPLNKLWFSKIKTVCAAIRANLLVSFTAVYK